MSHLDKGEIVERWKTQRIEVKWVGQKHTYGCMAAVAAMILGVEYEEGAAIFTDDPETLNHNAHGFFTLDSQLVNRDYAIARKYSVVQPNSQKREQWPVEPWADVHWCEVMHSETSRYAHAVLMLRNGSVLDPATPEPRRLSDYAKVNFIAAIVRV